MDEGAALERRALATVTLRPDPGAAAVWSAWGGLLIAAGIWFVVDAPTAPVSWVALLVFAAAAAFFVGQLVAPRLVEVELTQDELRARWFWRRRVIRWEQVHVAHVRQRFGDPVLELRIRDGAANRDPWELSTLGIPLPVGADLSALHRFLALRLGTGDFQRLRPL